MDGLRASVASLDALFLRDAQVDCAQDPDAEGEASVVDVLERKSELRLQRLAFWKQLAAQAAAGMAADATDFAEFQEAMTPPDATGAERAFVEMSTTAEVAGVLTLSPGAAAAFISQSRKVCAMPAVAGALASGL
ncbi:HNH endonuclease, partial [Pseudarthrobacter equi]|nr:HNH endonuclease [Pseudarthrobacter equi]